MKELFRISFLFLILLFPASVLTCQNNSRIFQHFTSDYGLTQNSISSVNQDGEGYIWIANYDGVSRFDGRNCKLISSSGTDSVTKQIVHADYLYKDHTGRIWMLNSNDLIRYDPLTGKTTYLSNSASFKKSVGHIDITALAEGEPGEMWVGTRKGVYLFNENKNTYTYFRHDTIGSVDYVYNKNRVRDLLYDKHGTLWIGTLSGLFKFSTGPHVFTSVFKPVDNPNLNLDDILSMVFDKTGNIWLAIRNDGIRVIDTTTDKITYINTTTTNNQLNSNNIGKLLCDRNGDLWISHFTKGINIYHPQTKEFETYRHDESDSHSLGDDRTSTLFEDRTGMIWIGTLSEGADGVSPIIHKFNTYIQHPGQSNTLCEKGITCATEDKDGNLWIGCENGLVFFNRKNNSFSCFHHEENNSNSLCYEYVQAIKMDRNGILWIGTGKGLNKYDPATGKWKLYMPDKNIATSLPSESVCGVFERSSGELWVSCHNKVARYVPEKDCFDNNYTNANIKLLKPEFYYSIFEDSKKTMWAASSRSGVYQLDSSFRIIHRYYVDETKQNGIPSNSINEFAEDKKGNIWMATNNGLCKLDPKTQQFSTYTAKQGLPSNLITQVEIADNGEIWVGSSLGLIQLSFDKDERLTVKKFSVSDGLQSNVFYSGSLKLRSGELFFGGSKGFNLFKPEKTIFNSLIPQVKVSAFRIFDKEFDYLPMIDSLHKIKLDYTQNFFSFDMAAMSFDYPEKNQFAYQLEGFDKEMIYCGNQNHVSYTNVPPGKYTLHIIASNNDGLWNTTGIKMKIEITPPFWKTWWFIFISVAILLVSFTLFIRYIFTRKLKKELVIIERQREIENVRSRISRDIHDEIGSGLTRISLLSELVKSNAGNESKDISLLEKIILSSREISNNLSEIIWTVNPEHDNLESLLSYMRQYINKFFEDSEILYKISFPDDDINNHAVHPDIKRNLFLILKESLNNIVKHAQAKNVIVSFDIHNTYFKLTIADDGIGMDESKKSKFGNGLTNIRSRAQSIKAMCSIRTSPGNGTTIVIEGLLNHSDLKPE